jgi:hypothetical protein
MTAFDDILQDHKSMSSVPNSIALLDINVQEFPGNDADCFEHLLEVTYDIK